jgi:XXXCH domain-containing protein
MAKKINKNKNTDKNKKSSSGKSKGGIFKTKFSQDVTMQDLPKYLEQLAGMFRRGNVTIADKEILINYISTLKLVLRFDEYDKIVKSKITIVQPESTSESNYHLKTMFIGKPGAAAKPPFKKLIKKLDDVYGVIAKSINKGSLPDPETVDAFYNYSELRTLYPGHGDEYYDDILQSSRMLAKDIKERNLAGARNSLSRLEYIFKECRRKQPVC